MNHVDFYNEKTPMIASHQSSCTYASIDPSQRTKILNIGIIVIGLLAFTLSTYYMYDGAKSLTEKSVKPIALTFDIVEIFCGAIGFLFACGLGGYGAALYGNYQDLKESYPNSEAYQGSITSDLIGFANSPQRDRFDKMIWGSYFSNFLDQFDPVLLDRYFLLKNVATEKRIEHFREKLQEGCCTGYTMALIAKMKKNSNLSCNELKDSIKIENVVYFQIVYAILFELNRSKALESIDELEKKLLKINKEQKKELFAEFLVSFDSSTTDPSKLLFNYCDLFSDGLLFHESKCVKLNSNFTLSALIKDAEDDIFTQNKRDLNELTLSGSIDLNLIDTKEIKSGHTFFFQISDGYFRFMDTGSRLNHFFKFETKDRMIDALEDHLKKCYSKYKDISLSIILVGIPKNEQFI
jgi:hypothetical protein